MTTKVLLVDDHSIVRKGLRLLMEAEEDISVVGEAGDGQKAIDLVRKLSPDVVVMDITMPGLNGIEATRRIMSESPDTKVLALSIHSGKVFVQDMLGAGASGYILKESAPEELLDAVRAIAGGEVYLSRAIAGVVVSQYKSALAGDKPIDGLDKLTLKEREEFQLLVEGHSLPKIALLLDVSEAAAELTRTRIMEKLGASDVGELTELARDLGATIKDGASGSPAAPSLSILKNKLYPPVIPPKHVHRTKLIERLEKNRHLPVTLVSAPAGYGKSTLVSCWLDHSDWPAAWLSLEEGESDLRVFLYSVLSAIESILPRSVKKTMELVKSPVLPPLDVLAGSLISDLDGVDQDFLLVLDDLHLIRGRQAHDLIAKLLNHPPRPLHLVLVSRRDPPLPLTRFRASEQLHEISIQDLRFKPNETAAYLQSILEKPMEESTAAAWTEKTEGWVTGLRLAALSISHRGDFNSLLPELQGGAQYVMEYLFNEVLSIQPPTVRRLLLKSAILDRFCAPLCAAIDSPEEDGVDCWEFIRSLQEENLFIIKLDAENQWFRYHHLFQLLLGNQLERHFSRDEIASFHSKASSWFAESGLIEKAIEHALSAGEETRAVQLVDQNRQKALNEDKWYLLEKWLSKFYDTIIDRHPSLLMTKAWVLYNQFEIPAIPPILDTCQSLMDETSADHPLRGEIDFFRGYIYYFIN
ncbi:response regulator, partial [bacterium]|nr:response regulator [bacterium]